MGETNELTLQALVYMAKEGKKLPLPKSGEREAVLVERSTAYPMMGYKRAELKLYTNSRLDFVVLYETYPGTILVKDATTGEEDTFGFDDCGWELLQAIKALWEGENFYFKPPFQGFDC
ncbi:hypothetical protein P74p58 [Thermus phage P74-26]|uniref:Uncharacterized protein n=1 Tax=Thermus phage P74-26 TaxID=2914007 RepID=A7XXN0_BP742|nr:hypothetical protein P74p58 [Thermus phage P74-26]ABU97008.1 hypothetical protein P74p58 [Thermus phage P74-26]